MTAPYIDELYADGESCEECGGRIDLGHGPYCTECDPPNLCPCGMKLGDGAGGLCLDCCKSSRAALSQVQT